jgi:perosamine synthetase
MQSISELAYLEKVLNAESWSATGGSWNNALERAFAELHGVKYAIAMNSGTATLHAALVALDVGPGDEVISPALTVIMDAAATVHAGATPVFADVDPYTFNLDPEDVQRKITPRTKAIIAVSLYGLPPDYDALQFGIPIIEDNAQCLLSTYKGRIAGSIGAMASYSFETSKHISCGEGGILITDNEALAVRARKLAGHGFKNLQAEEGRVRLDRDVFQNPHYKRHDTIGYNYRLSEFCAAVAMAQLENVSELLDARITSANLFLEAMAGCYYLIPQFIPEGYSHSYYTLGVLYHGADAIGVSWEDFRRAYIDNGGDGIYGAWSVPYQEPALSHLVCEPCPNAESIQPRLMQFKTNYKDMDLASMKADALAKTIEGFR